MAISNSLILRQKQGVLRELPIDVSPGYDYVPFVAPYFKTLERQVARHVPNETRRESGRVQC
jgi:hypothetical protein